MSQFSICIDMMFCELPFYQRFEVVKRSGYNRVEFWGWRERSIEKIKHGISRVSLDIALMNVDSKDENVSRKLWQGITSCDKLADFKEAIEQTVTIYKDLNVEKLVILPGNRRNDMTREQQMGMLYEGLIIAAEMAEKYKLMFVLEPLDLKNRPRSVLYQSEDGFNLIKKINSSRVKLLYDIYHQQITEGNLIETISENAELIGHIHLADVPGRHEPGSGEINFINILSMLNTLDYNISVGMEYIPTIDTEKSLERLKDYFGGNTHG